MCVIVLMAGWFSLDVRLDAVQGSLQHLDHQQRMQQLIPIDHFREQVDLPGNLGRNWIKKCKTWSIYGVSIHLPCAWPSELRSQRMDAQLKVNHPNCSICSCRVRLLYHLSRCSSYRTNLNQVLLNWHKFDPEPKSTEILSVLNEC